MDCGDFFEVDAGDALETMLKENFTVKEELEIDTDRVGDNAGSPENAAIGLEIKSNLQKTEDGPKTPAEVSLNATVSKRVLDKEEKFGHKRFHIDGGVSYKKISSTVIMDSVQIGIQKSVGGMALNPERDVLMKDFMTVETTNFTATDTECNGPERKLSFVFKTYAPIAFRHFRDLFGINPDYFVSSFCSAPLVELSNPGASGSLLYITNDDEFVLKTVQHKEAIFLQKLLPGYYLNLNQNPCTLLPKFFGLFCCLRDSKNVRLVAMNNILPSWIKIHQKYDLKGSTHKRLASKRELGKDSPTFKDLDFIEHHPQGIFLESEVHKNLTKTIQRDCRVLESFEIIDYSLLLGVHNLDETKRERLQNDENSDRFRLENSENKLQSGDGIAHLHLEENKTNLGSDLVSSTNQMSRPPEDEEQRDDKKKTERNVALRGIPAVQANGEKLLLFIGIIDILQSYRFSKRVEHVWKSIFSDGSSVSVHNPAFYAQRFQDFVFNSVLKPMSASPKSNKRKSASKHKAEDKNTNNL